MAEEKKFDLSLIASESLIKDLSTALSVDPKILSKLSQSLNTDEGLNTKDLQKIKPIWAESKMTAQDLHDTLSIIKFFFNLIVKEEAKVDSMLVEIEDLCKEKKIAGFKKRKKILSDFLTPKKNYLASRTTSIWESGILNNLLSVSGTVELRTAFKDIDSINIIGYVPVIQVRLTSGPDNDENKKETFCFQLNEYSLDKLIKKLQTFKKQVKKVKSQVGDNIKLLEN